ncbi:MAG TPA: OsmC family protein [Chloroflexota bacterium]|nr:OsmC family protein [Chloroflexota bacterium]
MSELMEGKVEWREGMTFAATSGSGHSITLDAAPLAGGEERGPQPMELLLLGLGGCTGMDVVSILRKMRQDVTGYEVQVRGERAADHPKVFTHITVEHVIRGRNLSAEAIRRAVELSATRYCSAAAMLGTVAKIEESYRMIDVATGGEVKQATATAMSPTP